MDKKKGVLLIAGLFILFMFFFNFVYAEITGEVGKETQVKINVTSEGPLPIIVYVSDIKNQFGTKDLRENNYTYFNFSFLGYAPSGITTLPDATNQNTNLNAKLIGPLLTRIKESCIYIGDTTFNHPVLGTIPVRNYSCTIKACFYDEPGTNNWIIVANLTDVYSRTVINNTVKTGFASLPAWERKPDALNWTSVSVGSDDQPADFAINIFNWGNMNINDVSVEAYNLSGAVIPEDKILPEWFAIKEGSSPGACTGGISLLDGIVINSGIAINHTSSTCENAASSQLGFCLKEIFGINAQLYVSGSKPWMLEASI